MKRAAVLASGRGSNMQALLDLEGCNIRVLYSHGKKNGSDLKAKRSGIPVFKSQKINFSDWIESLKTNRIKNILLLGFMRIIPSEFVQAFKDTIINIHPSLLPKYPGLNGFQQSWVKEDDIGLTLHFVVEEMDAGPKIYQSRSIQSQDRKGLTQESAYFISLFREHWVIRRLGEK